MSSHACPLCESPKTDLFAEEHQRVFFSCSACGLIHVPPEFLPSPQSERARYDTHRNSPDDLRYRRFLGRLAVPLVPHLLPGAEGLDYGAGPGPTLSVMLEEQGFPTAIYDPFYAPDTGVLTRTYDFVTCTETAEHFHTPRQEFQRLAQLLRPGGVLAVMTQILEDGTDFSQWRYAMDITHVCFYRSRTMEWIAAAFEFDLQRPHANVFFLRHRRDQHAPAHQRHPKNDPADPERRSSQ